MCAKATLLLLLLMLPSASLRAAQETTDAERMYWDAHRSDDQLTQLMGERWYNLVKLQEWTDSTGKFHADAKYVDHDANMKSVKLLVVKESDGQRETKELTVPFEKLDARCQSRVQQIDHLKPKFEAAVAALPKGNTTPDNPGDPAVARGSDAAEAAQAVPRGELTVEPAERLGPNQAMDPPRKLSVPMLARVGPFIYPNIFGPRAVFYLPSPAPPPAGEANAP